MRIQGIGKEALGLFGFLPGFLGRIASGASGLLGHARKLRALQFGLDADFGHGRRSDGRRSLLRLQGLDRVWDYLRLDLQL